MTNDVNPALSERVRPAVKLGGFALIPTFRFVLCLIFIFGIFLTAYWRSDGMLFVVAALLAAVTLLSFIYILILMTGIYVSFGFDEAVCQKNKSAQAVIFVENRTLLPVFYAAVKVMFPRCSDTGTAVSRETEIKLAELYCGGRSCGRGTVSAVFNRAGKYTATAETVLLYDPFGLFRARSRIMMSDSVAVLPTGSGVTIGTGRYEPRTTQSESIERPDTGRDEFFDIREYMPGDSLTDIHWKLSAKNDDLVVIRRTSPSEKCYCIYCDPGDYFGNGEADLEAADAVYETCAKLISELTAGGGSARAVWDGGTRKIDSPYEKESLLYDIVSSPLHAPDSFGKAEPKHLEGCVSLMIVTAKLSRELAGFISEMSASLPVRIPFDIVLCRSGDIADPAVLRQLETLSAQIVNAETKGGDTNG